MAKGFVDYLRAAMGWWSSPPVAVEVSYAVSSRLESVSRRLGTESAALACVTESVTRGLGTESVALTAPTESMTRRLKTETT